jgi:hypothetical protein
VIQLLKVFLFIYFCLFSAAVSAESEGVLNRLLAPGPLIGGHKDLEKSDCLKCHDAGKGVPDSKCLDCHKDIKVFVEQKKRFSWIGGQNLYRMSQRSQGP